LKKIEGHYHWGLALSHHDYVFRLLCYQQDTPPSEGGSPISFFGFWQAALTPIREIFAELITGRVPLMKIVPTE
jgi:hypothetical protein